MCAFRFKVIALQALVLQQLGFYKVLPFNVGDNKSEKQNQILRDIYEEHPFDTIVVFQAIPSIQEENIEFVYQFPEPKILLKKDSAFAYKKLYNSDILLVILVAEHMKTELMQAVARTTDNMRQARILIIAWNIEIVEEFQDNLIRMAQSYKMTNILLQLLESIDSPNLYQLRPYPSYHWLPMDDQSSGGFAYFPQHWRNMQQTSIVTYVNQMPPASLIYEDDQGNIKLNGYVVRLVLLFAEHFNASLRMYEPLKTNSMIHFMYINQLVEQNLVDIPMVMDIKEWTSPKWIHSLAIYRIEQCMLIVPCAQALSIQEVFSILLGAKFFVTLLVCFMTFSLVHCLIDYVLESVFQFSNLMLSDKILPGTLGQSFGASKSPWRSLKLIYILLFFAGLNISTQFSATMNTSLTSPPYHKQIKTLADIANSPLKIRVLKDDVALMGGVLMPIFRSVIFSDNVTEYDEQRLNFNTTTGYITTTPHWQMLNLKQQYFSHKAFCTYGNLTLFRLIPWTILLQQQSPYREPLNDLIHRVHDFGLMDAWLYSTFKDLLKLIVITLRDPNPKTGAQTLKVEDLYWAWIVVVIGLAVGSAIFVAELYHNKHYKKFSD
ncbi:uncharacterized protein LOC106087517 [Stomoxys calcitrans]|uniref:uncharacterized protein LOC106087517 n=1 Tax=Stomoxys calcitrans TaxID=35570 RepID=UPI0027E27BD6|nr:uncharacterized protein LOC106087517 [Stomoxys calcitrans]